MEMLTLILIRHRGAVALEGGREDGSTDWTRSELWTQGWRRIALARASVSARRGAQRDVSEGSGGTQSSKLLSKAIFSLAMMTARS
jgi:hypothetical protein